MITSLLPLSGLAQSGGLCYAKMESENLTRSMKIRSAAEILNRMPDFCRTIIESTSGNMGVALAWLCKARGVNCVLVVDPKLSPWHRDKMLEEGARLIDVTEKDDTGGWLKTRLAKVKDLLIEHPDWYWVNQYENEANPAAFEKVGEELIEQLFLQYVKSRSVYFFASVSTGGSLTGTARRLKVLEPMHRVVVVAVDARGSSIFSNAPGKRYLNGIGSSLPNPPNLDRSLIDEVTIVTDEEAFRSCYELRKKGLWVGGSSGAVYSAMKKYSHRIGFDDNAVGLFPDHGSIYQQTIYSDDWLKDCGFNVEEIKGVACVG